MTYERIKYAALDARVSFEIAERSKELVAKPSPTENEKKKATGTRKSARNVVMLLKKSIASDKKASRKILLLQEDKAKLRHELDLLKEENVGWKKLHEKSSSSMKMLQALIME